MGFGRMVTIKLKCPHNSFLMDETGNNTHSKNDSRRGGKKSTVTYGEIPKQEVGVGYVHFIIALFNNFFGKLCFVIVIFSSEKLHALWAIS